MSVMRATFANKLEMKRDAAQTSKVYFKHSYRCPVEAWFEETDTNSYGWVLQFSSKNSHILKQFRSDIFQDAISYIENRARKKATDITFNSIVKLAAATEIRSSENIEKREKK